MASIVNIPPELMVAMMTSLEMEDILALKKTCKAVHNIIEGSLWLSYQMGLEIAGKIDNPQCKAPTSRRLKMLEASESSWCSACPPTSFFSRTKKPSVSSEEDYIFAISPEYWIFGSPDDAEGARISTIMSTPLPRSAAYANEATRAGSQLKLTGDDNFYEVAMSDDVTIAVYRHVLGFILLHCSLRAFE